MGNLAHARQHFGAGDPVPDTVLSASEPHSSPDDVGPAVQRGWEAALRTRSQAVAARGLHGHTAPSPKHTRPHTSAPHQARNEASEVVIYNDSTSACSPPGAGPSPGVTDRKVSPPPLPPRLA